MNALSRGDGLSTGNAGWAAYRWSSNHAATDGDTDTDDTTDCNGEYKVSYLERAVDNYFVGAGLCLGDDLTNDHDDARVANLQRLVHLAMTSSNGINSLRSVATEREVNTGLETTCGAYAQANISSITWVATI